MPKIEVKNLRTSYFNKREETIVLENLDATFESGTFNVILGFSGCGKTTLLKDIIGLVPYSGDILLDGIDIETIPVPERNFSFVSQEYVLYPHLTIFDNIAFPLKLLKAKPKEILSRVNEIAEQFGLTACLSRKPRQISGGQQQKTAIARALIKRPSVCFFDEPFSNLDAQTRSESIYFLKSVVNKLGITVLYVTHSIQEATALGDRIYVINDKKIELVCNPGELIESDNPVVQELLKEEHDKN